MITQELKHWSFITEGERFDCTVPASLYGVLLENGKIEDPYWRDNEKALTDLSRRDCVMETEITVPEALLERSRVILRFEGIDTLSEIRLNGRRLGRTDNMHRTYEFDVKDRLHAGTNLLRVTLFSPVEYMEKQQAAHYVQGDGNSMNGIAHVRKASCMMGWDWGPSLPDMGIWRPVTLLAYDARILDTEVRQLHRNGKVTLHCAARTELCGMDATVLFTLTDPDGKLLARVPADADGEADLTVEAPRLWWPNGLGEHPLYTLRTELCRGSVCLCGDEKKIGLRTLTVSTARDAWGNEFCFVINGKKIFAMGADYVPEDNILSRITPERTERLIRRCVGANFNSLRVWGGGFYPHDYFYELCDRYGLIVWQDFMFACINVWLTEDFEETIRTEFEDNVRRIRHHACLGILCGNNEMELFVATSKSYGASEAVKRDYLRLYENLLPGICRSLAPDVFYWPSSPSSGGGFVTPGAEERGDAHYWDCWHGGKPLTEYRKHFFRFCSEFGFEALPDPETVETFTLPEDRNLFSPVMTGHQKCKPGNGRIMGYLADYYLYPTSFDGVIYGSQLLQADAIRMAVEHMRRNRGRCMGAVYWQLNDIWPAASWASVDSRGRRKALHFAAAKFFSPQLLSAHEDGTNVTFNVSNESLNGFEGQAVIRLVTRDLEVLEEVKTDVRLAPLSAADILTRDFAAARGREDTCLLTYALLDADGAVRSTGTTLFVRPKFFRYRRPDLRAAIAVTGPGRRSLRLTSDVFAHRVRISFGEPDADLSDNYVDLTSPEGVTVDFASDLSPEELSARLRLYSVWDMAPECNP